MREAQVAFCEVCAEALGLENAMVSETGVRDSGNKLGYIVHSLAMADEEDLHGKVEEMLSGSKMHGWSSRIELAIEICEWAAWRAVRDHT